VKYISNYNILIDSTKGVQYLNEIMELIVEGFEEAVKSGPLAKEKVIGLKVKLIDATIHEDPVHRGPAQIIPAARRPIYAGMLMAGVTLLEPKQNLFVQVPQQYMSEVISQIQGRRGVVESIEQEEEAVSIKSKVPVAEMFGFANDIRSASQGRAIWYHEYAGYEPLPKELQNKIVKEIRTRKGDPPDPPDPRIFLD
jgi:elongation factor 2